MANNRDKLEEYKMDSYVKLGAYVTDVQGFFPYIDELRSSVFRFKNDDMKTANTIFQSVINTYRGTKRLSKDDTITMISIHVRLTDFKHHLKVLWNMSFISNSFLTKAMEYYTKKYQVIIVLL